MHFPPLFLLEETINERIFNLCPRWFQVQGRLVDWGSKNIIAAAVQDIVTLYNGQNASDNTELENVEISNISALKWDNAGKNVRSDVNEKGRESDEFLFQARS